MSACCLQKAPINPYNSKHLASREFSILHYVKQLKKNEQNLKKLLLPLVFAVVRSQDIFLKKKKLHGFCTCDCLCKFAQLN